MELEGLEDLGMLEIFQNQMKRSQSVFCQIHFPKTIAAGFKTSSGPVLSDQILKKKLFPKIKTGDKKTTLMLVVDNLRYDQWKMIFP